MSLYDILVVAFFVLIIRVVVIYHRKRKHLTNFRPSREEWYMMLRKILEVLCIIALNRDYSPASANVSINQNYSPDESEWVPAYKRPISYDDDDE